MAYQQRENKDWMRLTGLFRSQKGTGSISGRLRSEDVLKLRLKLKEAADNNYDVVFVATKPQTSTPKSPVVNLSLGAFPPRDGYRGSATPDPDAGLNQQTIQQPAPATRPRNTATEIDF